jgi:hypothetical protein
MPSLPAHRPSVPPDSPDPSPSLPILSFRDVRLTVLTPHGKRRQAAFVRIAVASGESETALFVRAVREYRALHGPVQAIVAIDLAPG